jgi:ureidoglycolate dehydrogenase (NAD+)
MNQDTQELTVEPNQLREYCSTPYQKAGLSSEHAMVMAELQVETDLRGVYSHGTRVLPGYIQSVLDGDVNPAPELTVIREGPSYGVVEGDNASGNPSSAFAMEMAIEKAKKTGIAAVGVHNAGHFGAAVCYRMMAVREKMIGFATASAAARTVVAPGGATPVAENTALCYALPAGEERPIVLDMACGISAWNKIRTMHMYGIPIPSDWMLSADDKPTDDPDKGHMLAPAAGPKGYGLVTIMGILAGPLISCAAAVGHLSNSLFRKGSTVETQRLSGPHLRCIRNAH